MTDDNRNLIKHEPLKPPEQVSMDERREDIARLMGFTREHAEAYYQRGLQAYQDGDLENAILDLSEAIHYDRHHAEFYSTRGLFHLEANHEDDAELDLQYALKLSKRQWLAQYALGILDFRRGEYESAVKRLTEAIKYAAHRPELWFYRAVTYYYTKEYDKALADVEKAESLFPPKDKRIKEAEAWKAEIKKNAPATPKSPQLPPPNPPALKRP